MCAQACAYLANLLAYENCTRLYSIPEITALAEGVNSGEAQLSFGGLNLTSIANYFEKVGLTGVTLSFDEIGDFSDHARIKRLADRFCRIVRAYIRSGIPLIAQIDALRLRGLDHWRCRFDPYRFWETL